MALDFEIDLNEFKKLRDQRADVIVLDVREPWEWEICHFPEARLIPLDELPDRLGELDKSAHMIVHCKAGGRSLKAVEILRSVGFSKVKSLKGGINGWASLVDTSFPKY